MAAMHAEMMCDHSEGCSLEEMRRMDAPKTRDGGVPPRGESLPRIDSES